MSENGFLWLKNTLFALLLGVLFLPMLQKKWTLVQDPPLSGAFAHTSENLSDSLGWANWLDGSFQTTTNKRIEEGIGFRNSLVRLYNQWQFSLFSKANAEGVLIGRQGQLYEEDYLRAATGEFFLGEEVWQQKAHQLKALNDTLQKLGKQLVVIVEPGKGTVYPEHFPVKYAGKPIGNDNYHAMVKHFSTAGLHLFDLNQAFRQWADTSAFDLFPKTGTHWSYYGAVLAADSLFRYLEKLFPGRIQTFDVQEIVPAHELRHPDDDIWLAMNLMTAPPVGNVAYPKLHFPEKPANAPKLLIVGDSFYFNWQNEQLLLNTFADNHFWYYNKLIYNEVGAETGLVSDLDAVKAVLENDLILIMITERFHQNFAWGFDTFLYEHFFPGRISREDFFRNEVRIGNLEFIRLYHEAKAQNIPLTVRLENEAKGRMFDDWQKHPELYQDKAEVISMIEMAIQGSPEWFSQVKTKAADRKISVDEMLRLDAEWVYDQKQQQNH